MSLSFYSTGEDLEQTGFRPIFGRSGSGPRYSRVLTETAIPSSGSSASRQISNYFDDETLAVSAWTDDHPSSESHLYGVEFDKTTEGQAESSSIYFRDEFISTELRRAVELLDQGRHIIVAALESLREGNAKDSDERVMDFKEMLPELFCLRTISQSFGAIINAIQNGIANRRGMALSKEELTALDEILAALMREPAMSRDRSIDHVMKFEDAGFAVESEALGGLLELVELLGKEVGPADA